MSQVTSNIRTVEAYMDGFRKTDRAQILSCLSQDVEWVIPGFFRVRGKDEFDKHIVDEGFDRQSRHRRHSHGGGRGGRGRGGIRADTAK
jgi:limonene-1,2-epoxide hydrolase